MAKRQFNHEIISYTYKADSGKIHTAMVANQDKALEKDWQEDILPIDKDADDGCNCGQTKCVDKHLWKCMDMDGQGTCVWFITNELC